MNVKANASRQGTTSIPSVGGLLFDLTRAARGEHSAHDLGAALCDLEALVNRQTHLTMVQHEQLARAFALATASVIQLPASIRYADDIALGINAALRLLARWRAEVNYPFANGLRADIRIFRNALHNVDLRLQRRERELVEPEQKRSRIIDEILAPIQHLLSPPTDGKVVHFQTKIAHLGGDLA